MDYNKFPFARISATAGAVCSHRCSRRKLEGNLLLGADVELREGDVFESSEQFNQTVFKQKQQKLTSNIYILYVFNLDS